MSSFGLPFFKQVTKVVSNNDVYREHCQAKACEKDCNIGGRPYKVIACDYT